MPRATTGRVHHNRSKKILKDVKGFVGSRSALYRTAKDARRRALQNSYKDRRRRRRDMRSLWIVRISAAAKLCGVSYSFLISALKKTGIEINRKMLAEIAVSDMSSFQKIVDQAGGK